MLSICLEIFLSSALPMPIHAYQHHEEYGTPFTNKDHDRNPLTKLQLENRLQIEEIPLNELLKHLN